MIAEIGATIVALAFIIFGFFAVCYAIYAIIEYNAKKH